MPLVEISFVLNFLLLALNGIIFLVNRNDRRKSSAREKKYQAYSEFMKKMDAQSEIMRKSQGPLIQEVIKFSLKYTLASEETARKSLLEDFAEKFREFYQVGSHMIGIIQRESNNLFLLSSEDLHKILQELNSLAGQLKAFFDLQFDVIAKLKNVQELLNIQKELEKHNEIFVKFLI